MDEIKIDAHVGSSLEPPVIVEAPNKWGKILMRIGRRQAQSPANLTPAAARQIAYALLLYAERAESAEPRKSN